MIEIAITTFLPIYRITATNCNAAVHANDYNHLKKIVLQTLNEHIQSTNDRNTKIENIRKEKLIDLLSYFCVHDLLIKVPSPQPYL